MASNSNNAVVQMQKIASDTQIKLQQMTDASSAKTFAYNTAEAEKSRNWQTEMSNTSHQREVKDLIKAGLNPVLSSGGSGAQGYTTSSASGQADNAASAVASLQASRMSGLANIESSTISAKAQRAAAAASARAMKEAAATQAAAARYAAAMNYQSSIYKTDKAYELGKYQADKSYQAVIDKPVSNSWQFVDKYLQKSGTSDKAAKFVGKSIDKLIDEANKYFIGQNNREFHFSLSKAGEKLVDTQLKLLGIKQNTRNRIDFVNGFVFGNKKSAQAMQSQIRTQQRLNRYQRNLVFY